MGATGCCIVPRPCVAGTEAVPTQIHSALSLSSRIYHQLEQPKACYRLLNSTGVVGCAAEQTEAPLQVYKGSLDSLTGPRMLVIDQTQLHVLAELASHPAAQSVKGVLITAAAEATRNPAAKVPLAELAPYGLTGHQWNPAGQDILETAFPFSITQLDQNTTEQVLLWADSNEARAYAGAQHVSTIDEYMHGRTNSEKCLQAGTCKPLGGSSVWASLPLLPTESLGDTALPTILVLSSMDGSGLFHDLIEAADAPLSGLVAMLTAAQILNNGTASGQAFRKRLVFAAMAGEPWGLMGSRKLLQQLQHGSNATAGLDLNKIEQVVEVGPVGKLDAASPRLFVHTQRASSFGNASAILQALQAAGGTAQVDVQPAAASNPGVPPSSLMAWLKANASIAGVVLTEYDSAFPPEYATPYDTAERLQLPGIERTVMMLAHALAALAQGPGAAPIQVDAAAVQQTVAALTDCLIRKWPGLQCKLAGDMLTVSTPVWTSRYIGVINTVACEDQDPIPVTDYAQFVWNFLASATSSGSAALADGTQGPCDHDKKRCQAGAVCYAHRWNHPAGPGNGQCLWATARYAPSHSTRLSPKRCGYEDGWNVVDDEQLALGFPPDPMWTESNWDNHIPSVNFFQREAVNYERWLLVAGVLVTAGSAVVMYGAKTAYAYHHKQR